MVVCCYLQRALVVLSGLGRKRAVASKPDRKKTMIDRMRANESDSPKRVRGGGGRSSPGRGSSQNSTHCGGSVVVE
jgi:hypothetical protein